jgi:hypothetical protein
VEFREELGKSGLYWRLTRLAQFLMGLAQGKLKSGAALRLGRQDLLVGGDALRGRQTEMEGMGKHSSLPRGRDPSLILVWIKSFSRRCTAAGREVGIIWLI